MKKLLMLPLLLLCIAGCSDPGPTLGSREKFICTQCHTLPFPGLHPAAEWPAVVARMVVNMQAAKKTVPDAREQAAIIKFYQDKAGR